MIVKRVDSSDKDVSKYVFDFGDAVAESVLYKYGSYEERTVICCSTQSGCPMGCRFCGAGNNFVRDLTSDEIVAQIRYLFEDRSIETTSVKRGQIMFMSMGEPMLNLKNLIPAIRKLNNLFPSFALLVSTSAPRVDYSEFINISREIERVGLQFSVHESSDEERNKLIPLKGKLTLEEISNVGGRWFHATGRTPFFNYCAHDGNTYDEDVERLLNLFSPEIWQSTVSVICEPDESIAAANERQRSLAESFMAKMLGVGYSTRTFNPAGQDDIGGGCGQLWYVQDWMARNPHLAKPSVGNGLDIIHAPR